MKRCPQRSDLYRYTQSTADQSVYVLCIQFSDLFKDLDEWYIKCAFYAFFWDMHKSKLASGLTYFVGWRAIPQPLTLIID